MALPDRSFDVVVAQFVITAVPNPEATLDEFVRVIRPGGEIVLVNHIGAERGPRRLFETCFAPIARRLGWRPEFPFGAPGRLGRTPRRRALVERRAMPPLGQFLPDPLPAPAGDRTPQRRLRWNPGLCPAVVFPTFGLQREVQVKARTIRILTLAALAVPLAAIAQAPPQQKPPVAPKTEQLDPQACAPSDTPATMGKGAATDEKQSAHGNLSDKLARSNGVICPPAHVDSEIKAPTPPGGTMPVIPPPGARAGTSWCSRSSGTKEHFRPDCLTVFVWPPYIAPIPASGRSGGVAQLVRAAES